MDNETKERIIEDSKNWTDCNPINAYIAGAFAEHSRITELLKEKDERIAELLEALEAVIRLKPLIDYPNNTKEKHIGEAMAIDGMLHKVETAIAKGKQQ